MADPRNALVQRRLVILAAVWLAAISLVVAGVAQWSPGAALVTGGVLLAVWAFLTFGDVT